MTTGQRMLRNAAALFASQPITWTLSIVFIVLVPRNLGPTEWGEWVIAGSVGGIASAILDCGLTTVIAKHVPREPDQAGSYIGAVLSLRLLLFPVLIAGMVVFARVAGYRPHTQVVVALMALTISAGFVGKTFSAGLQALQRMPILAFVEVLTNALLTGSALWLLKVDALGIITISAVAFFTALAGQSVLWIALSRHVEVRPRLEAPMLRRVLRQGLPFWANQLFFMIYVWIDGVILSVLTTRSEVGWYGVGAQIIATLGFVPAIVTTVVFPELSRSIHTDQARTRAMAQSSFRLLTTLSLPMVTGLVLVADNLVRSVYGGWFAPAGAPRAVLALTLLPVYVATLGNSFIIAADRQLYWTWVMAGMCVVNPLLNLVAIPYFHARFGNGALGAALALLVTDLVTGCLALALLPSGLRSAIRGTAPAILRSVLATALMAVAVWPLRSYFIGIPLAAGVVTFACAAMVLRVYPPDELRALSSLVARIVLKPVRLLSNRPGSVQTDAESAA